MVISSVVNKLCVSVTGCMDPTRHSREATSLKLWKISQVVCLRALTWHRTPLQVSSRSSSHPTIATLSLDALSTPNQDRLRRNWLLDWLQDTHTPSQTSGRLAMNTKPSSPIFICWNGPLVVTWPLAYIKGGGVGGNPPPPPSTRAVSKKGYHTYNLLKLHR